MSGGNRARAAEDGSAADTSGAVVFGDAPVDLSDMDPLGGGPSEAVNPDGGVFGADDTGDSGARVVLDDVGHTFDRRDMLFRHITMTLHPRHVYALTGPSGSGKSTLLSIIAGWVKPTEGTVERRSCGRVCWVFQNPHGVARRRAVDHVALPFIARGESRKTAETHALELLEAFGLESRAYSRFSDLSGGEAQRLMLARGVASRAGLLLVDEPTAQLDLHAADTVNQRLHALSLSGAIVVVATHDPHTRDACTDVIDLREFQ